MTAPILTFFNNKGGVGKTSLVYHLAWMFAKMDKTVVVADLDPQANLTAAFVDEEKLAPLWASDNKSAATIYQCIKPFLGVGDFLPPQPRRITGNLHLLVGDVLLSEFEDSLSKEWNNIASNETALRTILTLTAFHKIMMETAKMVEADIIMADIGPNLGAINRSVLLATDYVVIPLAADLFSLQGLKNLGPVLEEWKKQWQVRLKYWGDSSSPEVKKLEPFPAGRMSPLGYVCQQHGTLKSRPARAYEKWMARIPTIYRENVDTSLTPAKSENVEQDPACLAMVKHYRSLAPMAQESRKPIFNLTSADGAFASHAVAAQAAGKDFREMAIKIAEKMGMPLDG